MLLLTASLCIGVLLAFANGANDNFKGVATLFGSGTSSYRAALAWATLTTLLGSLAALVLAQGLLAAFSGKGLVPPQVVGDPAFPAAVALAAGCTVLGATRCGFPISTTHALLGGLVGAGFVVSPTGIDVAMLGTTFVLPLLASPVLALLAASALYPLLRFARRRAGVSKATCVCVGSEVVALVAGSPDHAQALSTLRLPTLSIGTQASCEVRYQGDLLGMSAARLADAVHYLSSGAVGFARGLNDTPKIAALLLVGDCVAPSVAIVGVGLAMAVGGLSARRVAETMSHKVTALDPGQGLTANVVTSLLVIGASRWGVPVSTTHVSCGALFGIGSVTGQAHWKVIASILLAWIITLPVSAALGVAFAALLRSSG